MIVSVGLYVHTGVIVEMTFSKKQQKTIILLGYRKVTLGRLNLRNSIVLNFWKLKLSSAVYSNHGRSDDLFERMWVVHGLVAGDVCKHKFFTQSRWRGYDLSAYTFLLASEMECVFMRNPNLSEVQLALKLWDLI